jgi:hypothetical protein
VNRAACLLIAALTCAGAPKPTPSWKTFADCAAAYQASANVKDPTRSALDQKSIQGFADDYRDTAFGLRTPRNDEGVRRYVKSRVPAFAARSRKALERYIAACPAYDR